MTLPDEIIEMRVADDKADAINGGTGIILRPPPVDPLPPIEVDEEVSEMLRRVIRDAKTPNAAWPVSFVRGEYGVHALSDLVKLARQEGSDVVLRMGTAIVRLPCLTLADFAAKPEAHFRLTE